MPLPTHIQLPPWCGVHAVCTVPEAGQGCQAEFALHAASTEHQPAKAHSHSYRTPACATGLRSPQKARGWELQVGAGWRALTAAIWLFRQRSKYSGTGAASWCHSGTGGRGLVGAARQAASRRPRGRQQEGGGSLVVHRPSSWGKTWGGVVIQARGRAKGRVERIGVASSAEGGGGGGGSLRRVEAGDGGGTTGGGGGGGSQIEGTEGQGHSKCRHAAEETVGGSCGVAWVGGRRDGGTRAASAGVNHIAWGVRRGVPRGATRGDDGLERRLGNRKHAREGRELIRASYHGVAGGRGLGARMGVRGRASGRRVRLDGAAALRRRRRCCRNTGCSKAAGAGERRRARCRGASWVLGL